MFFLLAYFVGAIPTGYWFGKFFFNIDVTKAGSGNIGATNVARLLGTKYFFLIFFIDFFKTVAFLFSYVYFFQPKIEFIFLSAALLLIGNGYSIFLNFRGGKGVSTTLGILASFFPYTFLVFLFVWITVLAIFKKVFIASLVATFSIIPSYLFFADSYRMLTIFFLLFIVGFVFWRHKGNIKNAANYRN
jgi:glycerol-3-phosphate acyltransferase PlsY